MAVNGKRSKEFDSNNSHINKAPFCVFLVWNFDFVIGEECVEKVLALRRGSNSKRAVKKSMIISLHLSKIRLSCLFIPYNVVTSFFSVYSESAIRQTRWLQSFSEYSCIYTRPSQLNWVLTWWQLLTWHLGNNVPSSCSSSVGLLITDRKWLVDSGPHLRTVGWSPLVSIQQQTDSVNRSPAHSAAWKWWQTQHFQTPLHVNLLAFWDLNHHCDYTVATSGWDFQ